MDGFDEIEKQLLLSYIASGCYSMIKQWLMEDLPKTPKEIASIIYRLSTRGWIRPDETLD